MIDRKKLLQMVQDAKLVANNKGTETPKLDHIIYMLENEPEHLTMGQILSEISSSPALTAEDSSVLKQALFDIPIV